MKKIIFICHGNICRSPVAEILFGEEIVKSNRVDEFEYCSRATSLEEIGNDIYPPMKRVLFIHGDKFNRHYATRITKDEFDNADYIFYMDSNNLYYLEKLFGPSSKFILLRNYIDKRDIEDPWYTGRYELVYSEIKEGIVSILKNI